MGLGPVESEQETYDSSVEGKHVNHAQHRNRIKLFDNDDIVILGVDV